MSNPKNPAYTWPPATGPHGAYWKTAGADDVRALLAAGPGGPQGRLLAPDAHGCAPLHYAADASGNPQITDLLIAAGADVHARDSQGRAPLHCACAAPGAHTGGAASAEARAIVARLLAAGADSNAEDNYGNTPLRLAAGSACAPAITELLLAAGADVRAADAHGHTALHAAALQELGVSTMDADVLANDLDRIGALAPLPVRRAAYCDRTAWLMAIMADLAYMRLAAEDAASLLCLEKELAALADAGRIAEKLKSFAPPAPGADARLEQVLQAGGFHLVGVLFDKTTDTQGFIAANDALAVLAFRGTEKVRDWKTNLRADKVAVRGGPGGTATLGHVHRGFHDALLSVLPQIRTSLRALEALPLYITGHSLGGALATLATWHLPGDRLAACYTFGAPRVGDNGLNSLYRTPVYRIVNGADPVPFVPPSGRTIDVLKVILRGAGLVLGPAERLASLLVKYQSFRHYGSQRYLSMCAPGPDGTYPNLRNEFGTSPAERMLRYVGRMLKGSGGGAKRIDRYHAMGLYRDKLREYALRRNNASAWTPAPPQG